MTILDKINTPQDLRIIKKELLPDLIAEIRDEIIRTVSRTGGHLASSLGTVELAVALHYVYNAPKDKIIWDVGHQAYAHKLLTGRRERFRTLRTHGGISGFPKREESEYDAFGTGHSSTAISAALGFSAAADITKQDFKVVAVVGDGSLTGGLAFEGLQNAGHLGKDILVVLNDNEMFISHRVGAFAGYLAKLLTAGTIKKFEKRIELMAKRVHFWGAQILRVAKRFKVLLSPGMLFEEMGFAYLGPVDGHDVFRLIEILTAIKEMKGPILLHIVTKKGKGYQPAENEPTKFHGIGSFNILTGEPEASTKGISYTQVFNQSLVKLAKQDPKIVAITAAMQDGTGLGEFARQFPGRFFDVGIAESHALTFAAGLAAEGLRPVCAIYSTFVQRGLDQIIHDISLQKLPVVLALDRAGIVGEDGATHQGAFDLSFLRFIPNLTIMAPADENELQHMIKTAFSLDGPSAIRYPRGEGQGIDLDPEMKVLKTGKSFVIREGSDVYLLAIGTMVYPAMHAAEILAAKNVSAGVVNIRFIKPFDVDMLRDVRTKTTRLVTLEENALIGGLFSTVAELCSDSKTNILSIGFPDAFIEHGHPETLREKYGLTSEAIASRVLDWIRKTVRI
jgi:1-deoxy-D-xylulose-5-phosphate synthase